MKTAGIIGLTFFSALCLLSPAGAFEFMTSDGPGMGSSIMLSESSASVLVSVPTGSMVPGEWQVQMGASRKFDLSDLDRAFIAAAYRWRALTTSLGLMQFGQRDLYAERTLKWSLAVRRDSVSVGLSVSGMMVDISGGYGQLRAATIGAGASYRGGRWFVCAVGDNLTSPKLYEGSVARRPNYSLYGEFVGKASFSVTGRAAFQDTEKPQFALAQRLRLSGGSTIFWGVSTAPLTYGAGLELFVKRIWISYATSVHPVLGFSHTVALTFGSKQSRLRGDGFDQPR
ncbi:MAG TPA: hypothetical protein VMY05_11210 [Acidobacteriota bacterium]|nr:hypothetical protein [Acidobacteriota bacterium]